jgi:hypothetical protein
MISKLSILKVVRKGGLEPPRYCYRQPLKLAEVHTTPDQHSTHHPDPVHVGSRERVSFDSIRTYSHTSSYPKFSACPIPGALAGVHSQALNAPIVVDAHHERSDPILV